jgi:hypothetical protein
MKSKHSGALAAAMLALAGAFESVAQTTYAVRASVSDIATTWNYVAAARGHYRACPAYCPRTKRQKQNDLPANRQKRRRKMTRRERRAALK